ncbi:MATE family efflux transporter [Vibrio breoganii]|uniref:Multidrug resistance protein NorM n=1 Tax=Vibrio breoganii TaxID=553239 RepID=A0AAP8MWH3_9VIBR|nr:MATE family efflux transporter [Vibrio breoganii]PMG05703.1 MATE family efflux transporter [Vibrio breoganii]PMG08529.1 MATE family efflux transporter [Vibrio breoganii]PMG95405.1 MATE family efflux transporter [Vibrio breoganii]PMJ45388.1 MATE family efflux transporter [Vibrio breoganii]PMK55580.1 MATE family efflux transporter [Vibrio breoganii]
MKSQTSRTLGIELYKMTWPMIFGVLSLMSFQLIDSAFIAQLGVLPLAAQGFTLPIGQLIIGVQVGLGIATTSVIAHALGANDEKYAKQLGGLVLALGSVGCAAICLFLYLIRSPLLSLLGATEEVFPIIDTYWIVWLISSWVGAVLYFLYSVCRANGNTMLPGIMMVVTSILNVVLDPIFIFYFDMGIHGAAVATIIAFGIGILYVIYRIKSKHYYSFDWGNLDIKQSISSLFGIMMPAMTSQLMPPLAAMLSTKLLASYGTAAVAAWALGSRYEFFAIVSVLALTMSMPPMIGRFVGAKDSDKIIKLVNIACVYILGSQVLVALITLVISGQLATLMTGEQSVERILDMHLVIVPFSLAPLGVCILLVSVSNALGKPMKALLVSSCRLFVFFLPCLYAGAHLGGLQGLFIGAAIGNTLAGIFAWNNYRATISRLQKKWSQ